MGLPTCHLSEWFQHSLDTISRYISSLLFSVFWLSEFLLDTSGACLSFSQKMYSITCRFNSPQRTLPSPIPSEVTYSATTFKTLLVWLTAPIFAYSLQMKITIPCKTVRDFSPKTVWLQFPLHLLTLQVGWFGFWCFSLAWCTATWPVHPWRGLLPCRCWLWVMWCIVSPILRCPLSPQGMVTSQHCTSFFFSLWFGSDMLIYCTISFNLIVTLSCYLRVL